MITAKLKKRPVLKAVVTKPYQGKGYAEGYEAGQAEGYARGEQTATAAAQAHAAEILTDCNAVLPDKGVSPADTLEQVPQRIGEIDYLPNPLLYVTKIQGAYGNTVFPDGYELKLVMPNYQGNMTNLFYGAKGIRKLTLDVPTNVAYDMYGLIRDSSIEELVLPDGIHITSWNYFAYFASSLKRIIGRIDLTGNTSNGAALTNANSLEEVYFVPGTIEASIQITSPNLTDKTIESLTEGLVDLTGATAQKVTLNRDLGNKLTEAQKAAITAKNWTLVY